MKATNPLRITKIQWHGTTTAVAVRKLIWGPRVCNAHCRQSQPGCQALGQVPWAVVLALCVLGQSQSHLETLASLLFTWGRWKRSIPRTLFQNLRLSELACFSLRGEAIWSHANFREASVTTVKGCFPQSLPTAVCLISDRTFFSFSPAAAGRLTKGNSTEELSGKTF